MVVNQICWQEGVTLLFMNSFIIASNRTVIASTCVRVLSFPSIFLDSMKRISIAPSYAYSTEFDVFLVKSNWIKLMQSTLFPVE